MENLFNVEPLGTCEKHDCRILSNTEKLNITLSGSKRVEESTKSTKINSPAENCILKIHNIHKKTKCKHG